LRGLDDLLWLRYGLGTLLVHGLLQVVLIFFLGYL